MKRIYFYFLFCSIICSGFCASAQDIEGVPFGSIVDENLMKEKFGPDFTKGKKLINNRTIYIYGSDSIYVDPRGRLVGALLNTPRFTLDVNEINGGVKVGQMFTKERFSSFKYGHLSNFVGHEPDRTCTYYLDANDSDVAICIYYVRYSRINKIWATPSYGDDVEGVGIDEKISYNEVISKFGMPDSVKDYFDDFQGVDVYDYIYVDNGKESVLKFSHEYRLLDYEINSSKFRLFIDLIPGGLRIGDSIEKASPLLYKGGICDGECWDYYPILSFEDDILTHVGYYIRP